MKRLIGISKLHQVYIRRGSSGLSSPSRPMGEDGSVQGFLEVLKMPYVGCNILSSSLAMDKITTKRVLESVGIAQVPYVAIVEGDDMTAKIAEV